MNIKEFFGGCSHKWKEVCRQEWKATKEYLVTGATHESVYTKVELTCSKCGNIKVMEI